MKSSVLILVLCLSQLASCKEDAVNAKQMSQWIKARGTFSVSLVNLDDPTNLATQQQHSKDMQAISAGALGVNLGSKVLGATIGDEYDLFNNDKVELPIVCNPSSFPNSDFVKWERLTSIATGGKAMKGCWAQAAGQNETQINFLDMPILTAVQLAKFYQCASADYESQINASYILPQEGLMDPPALLTVATFGDFTRTDIGWLEMWVFMCCKAVQPKESFYLNKDPNAIKALMEKKTTQIAQNINNQNNAEIAVARAAAEKEQAQIQGGSSATNTPTSSKASRLAKSSVFSYAAMLKLEKANDSYTRQSKKNKQVEQMIETNSKAYHKKNKRFNKKSVQKMKLNTQAPELANSIQELYVRAQDPELIQYVKNHQAKRFAKNHKRNHRKHI